MTRRSEPKPDCGICQGFGFVMVSRDPDLEADCVCTDPPEPTPAEKVDAFARSIGVELMPWQRELAITLLSGEHTALSVLAVGRRGGLRTVRRVVEGARYV
ncbi:MAG: hypothetical protein BGN97_00350 [Microbacterium sp. 69-10]|uniref:hypothetical protein n=1 Tax=Microbacterium sp. 69-10 TaxID=1895783 RepID=UPI0009698ABD|nr:hypothetical protein [Microbacterium sp. 69-10]OJU39705.1 MAG: hypothetical protein BGN97_00350 [Microbacterium sp. 69-10]